MTFAQAYQLSKESKYFSQTHNIVSNFEKARIEALMHHNGQLDADAGAIKFILKMSAMDRFKYLFHLLKNPTVDLSADKNYLAKKLVNDGDHSAISVLLNNPKIDLSFDDNHLLKLASSHRDLDIVHLLLQDTNVKRIIGKDLQSDDDDLESLNSYYGNEDKDKAISEISFIFLKPESYILNSAYSKETMASIFDTEENARKLSHEPANMAQLEVENSIGQLDKDDESILGASQPPISSLSFKPDDSSDADSLTVFSEQEFDNTLNPKESKKNSKSEGIESNTNNDIELPASQGYDYLEWLEQNSLVSDPEIIKSKNYDEDYDWIDNDPDWETLGSDEESSGIKEIKNLLALVGRYWKDKG